MRRGLALGALFLAAAGQAPPPDPKAKIYMPAPVPSEPDPFSIANWFDLAPAGSGALAPSRSNALDLGVRDDDPNSIFVFGKKRKIEPRLWQRQDLGNPLFIEAAGPRDRLLPPHTNCAGSAYNTIGGQAATGRDLMGVAGAGASC